MIWFTCKKCGKTHGRPENSAGTMIFCDCGSGTTVPWESSATEPAAPPATAAPRVPDLAPIQFDPVSSSSPGMPTQASSKPGSTYPKSPPPLDDDDRPTRRGRNEKRDPDYCFNHQRRPKAQVCAECEETFCAGCLVKFQDTALCGPCKNFRARREELPPVSGSMANASLIIAIIAGPLMVCFLLWSPGNDAMRVLSWLSLLPQAMALGMGAWALLDAEREHKAGGQWVAVSGVTAASLACIMMLLLNLAATKIAVPT